MDERTLHGEVIYAIEADEVVEYDLQAELEALADDHRILVLREGGKPSRIQRLLAVLRRDPIEAVTLVTDATAVEGDGIEMRVRETDLVNVFVDAELSVDGPLGAGDSAGGVTADATTDGTADAS